MVWSVGHCALHSVHHLLRLTQQLLTSVRALTNSDHNSDLRVYVTGDGSDVYEDSFMKIAKPDGATFKPTLVLVGTRLGIDKVTPAYWDALEACLKMSQSIGIAG
jgi:cysteine protease ATG4